LFRVDTRPPSNAKYYLFISSGKLAEFRKLDSTGGADGKLTIKVTTDFQYGQKDKTGKNRFLVYHEEDRKVMKQVSRCDPQDRNVV
jgi:hypothetical protein